MPCGRSVIRVEYTHEHDKYLVKFLAKYCPTKEGRSGQKIYKWLVANEGNKWPWAVHHTAQSWRERYVRHSENFDAAILSYQSKHSVKSGAAKKRVADSTPTETLERHAKRVKRERKERVPSSETPTEQGLFTQGTNTEPPTPKPNRNRPPQAPEPEQHTTPRRPTHTTETQSIRDLPSVQRQDDALQPAGKQIPSPTNGVPQPQPVTLSRPTKRFKERPRDLSDIFTSNPSTPQGDAIVAVPDVNPAGPSSHTRSAPHTSADSIPAPVAPPTHPRAPPRLVNTFQGQVLVDRKGRVPRLFSQGEIDAFKKEEDTQEKAQWPPVRSHAARHNKANEPVSEGNARHPFKQPIILPRSEAPRKAGERELDRKLHPIHGLPTVDGTLRDLGTETHGGVASEAVSKQRQDGAPSSASPVKRVVPPSSGPVIHTPPPDLLDAVLAKWRLDKPSMFPPPRASAQSPVRPSPSGGRRDRHSPPRVQPRLPPRSPAKAVRDPALMRLRRETIAHGGRNDFGRGPQRERRRPYATVPSVDLVALSHSSLSARSPSRSSVEVEAVGDAARLKPKRWSFPATVRRRADTAEGEGGSSGSGSGSGSPFRWAASEWGRGALWTSSPIRRSTSFSSLTPSALGLASFSHRFPSSLAPPSSLSPSLAPSCNRAPHVADLSLAASHGLASMLAHMAANHGMAFEVVEAVYARVGSLRETDEVLKGMREAAEGWGEREIKRLVSSGRSGSGSRTGGGSGRARKRKLERGRKRLRYVVASEDGEGSEYSPPETSRAAMWKRYSGSTSGADEELEVGVTEEGDDEDEDRQVEKELQYDDNDDDDDDEDDGRGAGNAGGVQELTDAEDLLMVEQVLLDNVKAQELERKMGKGRFHRELVSRFR